MLVGSVCVDLRLGLGVDVAEGKGQLLVHDFGLHLAPGLAHLLFFLLAQLTNGHDLALRDLMAGLHVVLQFLLRRVLILLQLHVLHLLIQILLLLILLVRVQLALRLRHLIVRIQCQLRVRPFHFNGER